jgi:hypothetical protein
MSIGRKLLVGLALGAAGGYAAWRIRESNSLYHVKKKEFFGDADEPGTKADVNAEIVAPAVV